MSEKRPPLGILLLDGGHERAHYALVMASGAAALGRDVVLFATNGGCRLLLADCPLLQDPREAHLASRGVAGVSTLLAAIAACIRNRRRPAWCQPVPKPACLAP